MPDLCYRFCEYHNTYVDKDLVKLQSEAAKRNNEGIGNAPEPVYSYNISEGEAVRQILI